MRPEALARAHLAARNYGFAETTARQAALKNPNQVPALAAQVEVLHAVGKEKEARDAYRVLEPLARWADRDLPVFRRLENVVARWKAEGSWMDPGLADGQLRRHRRDCRRPDRPEDARSLGLEPIQCRRAFIGTDTAGVPWNLASHKGKNVLVIFFLGGKCAHCMQQLELFGKEYEALKKLDVETVAISSDDVAAATVLKEQQGRHQVPHADAGGPQARAFQALSRVRRFREPTAPRARS